MYGVNSSKNIVLIGLMQATMKQKKGTGFYSQFPFYSNTLMFIISYLF
ncbi:MAG: hypothetical protein JWR38_1923 [Mucilaginibacter sp.]|nr:hypothetical protein [Mucilaginibacter sp.]